MRYGGNSEFVTRTIRTLTRVAAIVVMLLVCLSSGAIAADPTPLRVPDTSSPRATLQGFIQTTDDLYTRWADLLTSYWDSGELYPTPNQRQLQKDILGGVPNAVHSLNMSEVPPVELGIVGAERAVQLREILDRIDLPSMQDVPDAAAMANQPAKRWRLPDTEIDFVLVQQGPRAGEYLVSPETVERLPEFYQRVKDLPYKEGPARRVDEAHRRFSPNSNRTVYDILSGSPLGLSYVIPLRWVLNWPDWSRALIGGATVWQWIGVGIGGFIAGLLILFSRRLASRLAQENEDKPSRRWHTLPLPIGILIVAAVLTPVLCTIIRIGGTPRIVITVLQTVVIYLTCAWLALVSCALMGEIIVGTEHLAIRSLDGQLIRLGSRLFGALIVVGCLIKGADQLGFPAYSVLAGLGVGGLAVALAAKDSLANLLGSMLIMFEKPFRVGHYIRLKGTEGTVEDVGFRSTRIRTQDNSLISIPNDSVINTTVENLSLRPKRRQRFTVGVTYDTKLTALEAFVEGIREVILEHDLTDKNNIQVSFNNLADSSLDILVIFHLLVTDYPSELKGRHEVLVQIMNLAERMGVAFAFPTRTLLIEGSPVIGGSPGTGPTDHSDILRFGKAGPARAATRAAIAD
jgi:MscS family membrane protein